MLDFIRRFGLAYHDIPTMFDNVAYLLRMVLVNIQRQYTKRIPIIFYVIQIVTGVSYIYVFMMSVLWFVFFKCVETKDIVAATVVLSLGACSFTGVAKLLYIWIYNEAIKDLVDEYLACDASVARGTRFYTNLLKALRDLKKRALGIWSFLTLNGIVYVTVPLILPGRHFMEDLFVLYGLEPMFETPNYEIAYVIMVAGVYYGVTAETSTSALLIIITGYIEAKLLALSEELDNLWDDANTLCQDAEDISESDGNINKDIILNQHVRKLLRDIARKLITSIHLLGQVEKVFRTAMAIEFAFLILGLTAGLLGGLESTYLQLPFSLLQVAMDCFIGQRLMDASLVLENAIYNCKWENFDVANQRTVYLMLMNAQKTLTFSVGGLTVLSFSYFMSVIKAIYSVYTTLRTRM